MAESILFISMSIIAILGIYALEWAVNEIENQTK